MTDKRRLPVLSNATEPSPAPDDAPPPWHWIPLGAVVTIAVGLVLAKSFYLPFMQRQLATMYGGAHSAGDVQRIDATITDAARHALQLRLFLAALPIAVLAVVAGSIVVTRFGAATNARHGTLSGLTSMVLLVALAGRAAHSWSEVAATAVLVPFGAVVGYLGGRIGVALRG